MALNKIIITIFALSMTSIYASKTHDQFCEIAVAIGLPDTEIVGTPKFSEEYVELFRLPSGQRERTTDGSINDLKVDSCNRLLVDFVDQTLTPAYRKGL